MRMIGFYLVMLFYFGIVGLVAGDDWEEVVARACLWPFWLLRGIWRGARRLWRSE